MDPDTCSSMGQSEPPGAEHTVIMFVQLRIPHLDADGDWGEETTSLGLRRMVVMSSGHIEGPGSVPRSSHPPPGFWLLGLLYVRNSCGNRKEGIWLIEGEASLETVSVEDAGRAT